MRRILLMMILGGLVGFWEIVLVPFFAPWASIHLLVPMSILILIGSNRTKALAFACSGGLLMDVYAVAGVDFAFVRSALLVLFLDFLLRQWLTNRSLYVAVGLACIGRLFDQVLHWIFGSLIGWISASPYGLVVGSVPWNTWVWDIVIVGIGFLLLATFTRRLSSMFHGFRRGETYGTIE